MESNEKQSKNNFLYSSEQVAIATFFGLPIAGIVLLASNYRKVNDAVAGRIALICGGIFTLIYIVGMILIKIPNFFIFFLQIAVCVGMKLLAKHLQGGIYNEYIKNGWKKASDWRAVGIGLLWSGIFIVLFILYDKYSPAENAKDYLNQGVDYESQHNFTQAIADFNKAIKLNPNLEEAYLDRGSVYNEQGNYTQAIADYNKAIELNPKDADIYTSRGTAYVGQGNLTQALADYNKVIELTPDAGSAYNDRASVHYKLNEYDKAWADIHKAEELGYKPDKDDLELLGKLKKASGRDK